MIYNDTYETNKLHWNRGKAKVTCSKSIVYGVHAFTTRFTYASICEQTQHTEIDSFTFHMRQRNALQHCESSDKIARAKDENVISLIWY